MQTPNTANLTQWMKPVFWHWCMTLMESLLEMLHILESNFKQLCQTWNVSVWFRKAPVGLTTLSIISGVAFRLRILPSDLEQNRLVSDTTVWIRALPSDFGHYRPISDTIVRFRTLSSDFRHCRPISFTTFLFQTPLAEFRHYHPISHSTPISASLSNFGLYHPVSDPTVRSRTLYSDLRPCCPTLDTTPWFQTTNSNFKHFRLIFIETQITTSL